MYDFASENHERLSDLMTQRPKGALASHQIVQEQVGVHDESEAPMARGAHIDNDGKKEHSNVHLGELYWGSNPSDRSSTPNEETRLGVEVDYVGNRDPRDVTNPYDVPVLEAAARNFQLYGLAIDFEVHDGVSEAELRNVCKLRLKGECFSYVTPDSFNRHELDLIENRYHQDQSKLHLLWGTKIRNDYPKTPIDMNIDYNASTAGGIAWHTGAPKAERVDWIEDDFGVMIARDEFSGGVFLYRQLQSVTMHELGHALSIGWVDDAPIPWIGDNRVLAVPQSNDSQIAVYSVRSSSPNGIHPREISRFTNW